LSGTKRDAAEASIGSFHQIIVVRCYNTVADNDSPLGSAILADGFDAGTLLINNIIVALPGQTAVLCGDFNDRNPPQFRFNNVFSQSGSAYGGICTDQTGLNGNISALPSLSILSVVTITCLKVHRASTLGIAALPRCLPLISTVTRACSTAMAMVLPF
jgi:hypothetical protein